NINISGSHFGQERLEVTQSSPKLIKELSGTVFRGLSGVFSLINGQLQSSNFQVVNVNDNGEKGVGYWTPQNGLVRNLSSKDPAGRYSNSCAKLGTIIWPGDTTSVPRGWRFPGDGRILKILVPVNKSFGEFVHVSGSDFSGYCIEVFEAVLNSLAYGVPYAFYPFANSDGESAGTYDDLVYQVFLRNYDAAVGDITIRASFVTELGDKAQVPIISFSATSSSLQSSYFLRIAQNDTSQVKAISDLIQAFSWSEAVPISVDNEFGKGMIPYLTTALQAIGARIPYWVVIPSLATADQIDEELEKLMKMQTRVFIVHMLPSLGSRLFARAKKLGMMDESFAWIITNGMTNYFSSVNSSFIDDMNGVLGLKAYIPKTKELGNFRGRWQGNFQQDNSTLPSVNLDVFGFWAYDAAWALAMAVENVDTASFKFQNMNISGSSTGLERLEISLSGPELVRELSSTRFIGISGDFSLLDGQLQSSTFEVVNVNNNGERGIGYWTPRNGFVRNLNSENASTYSTSNASLGPIIWPGETTSAPKGWQIPTGAKLKVLIPVKTGFTEFVNISTDPNTHTTDITGYGIEVFNAVIKSLPFPVPYEFHPFAKPNGESAGSYNDLLDQVFLGNYDAAVGDITIRANRSLYVDFTLPYTESGISMIVPIKDHKVAKTTWVFLKPFTLELWVTSGCFFIFIGFVVWVLEHRINEDFRGPPRHQIGTSLWYSFSTMVFAHRERVMSNLARFVVITWCFVVLILTQSYTASFSSILTVQQLQKNSTDVNQLLKNGENVGYQLGSFVLGTLQHLGFRDDKLRVYNTVEELNKLLQMGSENNGISAAFDETPYMKLFLATYCSKYTMVEPTFKADGFAFAFQKGSLLTRYVSREIEGTDLTKIEEKWLVKTTSCSDSNAGDSSNNTLTVDSFWGLFIIAGVASSLALLIFAAMFFYEHRHTLLNLDPETTFWGRIRAILRIYDQRDPTSHTYNRRGLQDPVHGLSAVESLPDTNSSARASSAHRIDSHIDLEQHVRTEHADLNPNTQATQEIEDAIDLTSSSEQRPVPR
ncbi:glutamate receptor 2.9-like, partial [Rosa rugosa]|uniref:glutamate receptor 2.9-like n=1 Tax=Rosa rugosa TaxID=74645 RepID=UPI002B41151F